MASSAQATTGCARTRFADDLGQLEAICAGRAHTRWLAARARLSANNERPAKIPFGIIASERSAERSTDAESA